MFCCGLALLRSRHVENAEMPPLRAFVLPESCSFNGGANHRNRDVSEPDQPTFTLISPPPLRPFPIAPRRKPGSTRQPSRALKSESQLTPGSEKNAQSVSSVLSEFRH